MKIIGITPRILIEDGVEKQFVNTRYLKQLTNRGFNVIMLTLDNPNPNEILNLCDGFVITGGYDISPKCYNEDNLGLSHNCSDLLDSIDRVVIEYAKKSKKPLLGICRGEQAINVFLGGSLHQDIGEDHKSVKIEHYLKTSTNRYLHFKDSITVNSYHHQAVKDLAPDMEIIAKHVDGTIEAIIHKILPIIGVQWHPEMIPDSEESKIIFDQFAKLVYENKN